MGKSFPERAPVVTLDVSDPIVQGMHVTFWVLGPGMCQKCLSPSTTSETARNLHVRLGDVEEDGEVSTSCRQRLNSLHPGKGKLGKSSSLLCRRPSPAQAGLKGQEAQPATLLVARGRR